MRYLLVALFFSIALFACTKQERTEKAFVPRALKTGEQFNEISKLKDEVLSVSKTDSGENEIHDQFQITFRDTIITVKKNPKPLANKFFRPRFLNSQKTALIAQVADGSGLVSPFYIFSVKDRKVEVVELDRSSKGKNDRKSTKGIEELSRSSFVVNNDFLVTTINGKIYPIKRQIEDERIDGKIFMVSRDGATLVFLTGTSLYQFNYLTGETFNLPVDPKILNNKGTIYNRVQNNYSWFKNAKGMLFLKENVDDNRIVDIKEFKH